MKRTIVSYMFAFVALMFMQARGAYLVTASRDYVDKQVAAVKTNIIISVEAATNDMWHAISNKAEKEISYSKTVFTPPQLSTNDVWLLSADYLEPGDEIVMRYGSRGSFGDNGDCDRWIGNDTLRTALAFDYNDSVWIVTNVNSIAQQGGIALETNLVFSLIGTDSVMLAFSRQTESITNGTYSVVYEDELEDIISSVEPKNYEAVSSAALSAIQSVSVNGETLVTNDNRSVNVVVPIPATLDLPVISGDANVGESDKFAREDHVHPAETKVLAYAIPDARFPMSYMSNGTNYTVSCNDELRFDVESVYIYMYNVDKSLCIAKFNKTAPYAYGALGSLLVSNLKFNMDGTPTDPEMDSWPTLRDDAAYVRDVQVARESDVAEQMALKANEDFVVEEDAKTYTNAVAAAKTYTDTASQALMVELHSATNSLEAAIAAATPGNYAVVSNKAMTALQSFTETDPTVPSWAKVETPPYLTEHQSLTNYYTKTQTESFIAPEWTSGSFVGTSQLVFHDHVLYKCDSAHSSTAFNPSYFTVACIQDVLGLKASSYSPYFTGQPTAPDIGADTRSQVATKNYVEASVPTNVSAFTNDAGYLTQQSLSGKLDNDFDSLTNSAAFTSAVAAVSPPTDLTGYAQIITDPANIPASGYALLITENESYLTNITEQVSGNVTNIVTTVTTNSYPVLALYSDGTKVWTSDPAEQGTGYYVALILAIVAAAGGFVWRFFAKTTNILKVDPETGDIYYETED